MIWLPCERKVDDEDRTPYESVDPHPHLGPDIPLVGTMRIEHNPIRDRNLGSGFVYWAPRKEGYSVALKFREAFSVDGSAMNRSLLTSVATSGVTPHQWCGPIVALRELPFEFYDDITLVDFRHIIDYLRSYRTTEVRESASDQDGHPSSRIRGVKICCYGEVKLHGSEPYVSVNVSRAHPTRLTYANGAVSPLSQLLGVPLRLWIDPSDTARIDPPGWSESMGASANENAALLMTETDPEKPG